MAEATGQTAYQAVFDAIAAGRIKPGERLRETDLAETIGLSRTPVREAIRRLEAEGLVTHEPRIGAVVKTLTQQEIVELYEMRIVLETTAASMAAKHASDAEVRTLLKLNTEMLDASDDPSAVAAINQRFHMCIVNAELSQFGQLVDPIGADNVGNARTSKIRLCATPKHYRGAGQRGCE